MFSRPVHLPTRRALAASIGLALCAAPAAALDVQVKDVHATASAVRTTIELRGVLPDRFRKMVEEGTVLHLRVQTELWESRPVWDRLVYPAIVKVFRLGRAGSSRDVSIADTSGSANAITPMPPSMPMEVDLGDRGRVTATERYYVHVIATLGTLADREVDEAGDAVFGRESEANTLGSLGRMVFRTAVKVNDYLQGVSAEVRGRKLSGADILKPTVP